MRLRVLGCSLRRCAYIRLTYALLPLITMRTIHLYLHVNMSAAANANKNTHNAHPGIQLSTQARLVRMNMMKHVAVMLRFMSPVH